MTEKNLADNFPAGYKPPEVWTWEKGNGGQFARINRPIAGATFDKELQVGKHPFQLYSLGTPNGIKVTIMLEELLALGHRQAEYDAWLINIFKGDQFGSGFTEINPGNLFNRTECTYRSTYTRDQNGLSATKRNTRARPSHLRHKNLQNGSVSSYSTVKNKKRSTHPNNHNIRMTRSLSPPDSPINPRSIQELPKHEARRLPLWRFRQNCNNQRRRSEGVPPYGNVVQVVQNRDSECVCETLGEEHGCVDA